MAFLGLFVGIDRYESPAVDWLSSAARDARALYSLFADSFGADGASLLLDDQATRGAIEAEFQRLAACDESDVVVVAFSGHGTPTHELVTHDADARRIFETCIPLDVLTGWFARIPSKRLVCFLDCCFSGGMGAKVLQVDVVPRAVDFTDAHLNQLSGEGRIILTASTANEEAHESSKLGHGFLTYYLMEALQGADEVRSAGQVSVYRLLEYVTQRVADATATFGKQQHPTLRGTIDGELRWPVLKPGPIYARFFPERVRQPATADLASLASFGFPQHMVDAWSASIPTLNQLQLDAINDFGVLDGQNLVVVAPTSSGKTMVGELAAMKSALERKRACFLLPLKALVNDKHQEFTRRYEAFGLTVIRATGEIADDIPALMRGQYDVCLMTYEKFAALALGSPHLLEHVGVIVVDEVQMIADPGRGVNVEFLLTHLKVRRTAGIAPQLIALSGVIGDTNGLERWLNARLLRRNERPVPLNEGMLQGPGTYHYIDSAAVEQSQTYVTPEWGAASVQRALLIPLVRRLTSEGKQVIVFRQTRGEARACAIYLSQALGLPAATEAIEALPAGDPSNASQALRAALRGGIAFHISDLDREERQVIEERFRVRDSEIRVICATTTLAMGVNTPAEAVVIVGLDHPNGPYSVAEYKNMVGRAGRLGFSTHGDSFLLAPSDHDAHRYWKDYVLATPEEVTSRFFERGRDLRSQIVRVLAASQQRANVGLHADEVVGFLEDSFGAFLLRALGERPVDPDAILQALSDMARRGLLEVDDDQRYCLTQLGRLAGEAGVEIASILRLVEAVQACSPEWLSDPALLAATQLTTELDEMLFPLNKKSKNKEPAAWPGELQRQGVPRQILVMMLKNARDQHDPTLRAKKAVACLLWITDKPLGEVERIMTQFGSGFDGAAGAIRAVAQRTADLLPVVCRVAELLHPGLDLSERRARLLTRLELGIPSAAVEVALASRGYLGRADYLALVKAGLASCDAIATAEDNALLACLARSKEKLAQVRAAVRVAMKEREALADLEDALPVYQP